MIRALGERLGGGSLRGRLVASVVAVLALVLGGFSFVLYTAFSRGLWRTFDERLKADARAITDMVEEHSKTYRFEWEGITRVPPYDRQNAKAFFQIWKPTGQVLERSKSLGRNRDLPATPDVTAPARIREITMPDGRPGRLYEGPLYARWVSKSLKVPPPGRRPVYVAVAHGTDDELATLARLRALLLGLGAMALGIAAVAGTLTIARGLRPARDLAGAIGRIDENRLGTRITIADLPPELEPPVAKLNELLGRMDESFARERRFTSDVSHELRTPLAGLRSLLEVTASRERAPAEYRATVEEAIRIVKQMNAMIENLLMLARLEADQVELHEAPIALREFVDDCWRPFAARARARGLLFVNDVPPELEAVSDADKLRLVVSNLFSNAAEYTAPGGRVNVRCGTGAVLLDVCNTGPPIPEAALPRLFERFFRADSARADAGVHCGIGLALVKAVCGPLRLEPSAHNMPDGSVRFRLTRITAPPPPPRTPPPRPPAPTRRPVPATA